MFFVLLLLQTDLEDQANELRAAEEQAKRAIADVARLADEVQKEQEHSAQIEKLRRSLEAQVGVWTLDYIAWAFCGTYISFTWENAVDNCNPVFN